MIRIDDESLGPVRVVAEGDLLAYTQAGWRLLLVVQEVIPGPYEESQEVAAGSARYNTVIRETTVTKYVLGQPKDQAVKELSELLAETEESLGRHVKRASDAEAKLATTEKELVGADARCRHATELASHRLDLFQGSEKEVSALRMELRRLLEASSNATYVTQLEDWITRVGRLDSGVVAVLLAQVGPMPVKMPKTWAERLVADDSDYEEPTPSVPEADDDNPFT